MHEEKNIIPKSAIVAVGISLAIVLYASIGSDDRLMAIATISFIVAGIAWAIDEQQLVKKKKK